MNTQKKGMTGKDIITVGIFSAIYFVINFAFMLLSGLHPLLWILMPGLIAVFAGIPFLMMCTKVPKTGAVVLMGFITALIYFVTGQFTVVILIAFAVSCILAELCRICSHYRSFRGNALAYVFFSLGMIGAPALACAVVLAVVGGVLALSRMGGGLAPDQLLMTNPNGDSIWTFSLGYICRNLPATAKLLLRTIPAQGALWLQGILGTTLGEPIVYRIDVSWLLGVGLVLALLAAALPVQDEPDEPLLGRRTGFGVLGIILCVAAASLVVALNWTPINYETLFGMQGRYWLPVLPLALLLVKGNRSVCARRDLSRGAALAVTACTLLTLLQGYSLYASWQPVS